MPDMIPVATQIQPPDPSKGLATLSSIIGIRQQQQALQTGAYEQQKAQAGAIAAQQNAKELQAGSKLLADPIGNGLIDEEGNPTKNAYSIIKSVMPTTGDERYTSLLKTAQGHVEFRNSVQNLSQNEQGYISSRLAGIAADPNAHISDVVNGINDLESQFKGTAEEASVHRLVKVVKDAIDDAGDKHGMDGVRQVVNGFSRGAIGNAGITGPGGVVTPSATTMQAPGGLQPIQTNPMAPGGIRPIGQPLPQGVAPSIISTPAGPLARTNAAGTSLTPLTTAPGAQQPNLNTTRAQQENVQGMATDDRGRYAQVSQEGSNATTGAQLADQVAQLAEQVRTGKLSKEWTDRLTVLQQHDPSLTARQMLSKYAAQLKTMATAGATTDASRSQIDEGMPSPETMGPDAVKEAAQYVGGIFRMRGARQEHANRYQESNGNSIGFREADDAFMRAADPTVFTYKNLPAGEERQKFLISHGLNTPEKIQAFKARLNQVNHYSGGQ